ncbi:M20 family metallo-hydrolase [Priestia endophytica]|nr:M20 family metallo-hydrolase [Priestia endophytica]KYG27848.1 Zn-dependent hydrolase [Priestia endophytica]
MLTSSIINHKRVESRIKELSAIGKIEETGVCRLALSKEDRQAVELVQSWMNEGGLKTHIDNFGNLVGRLEGRDKSAPVLRIGSHIDSQPYGGRFDGVIGVIGGLEVAQTLHEKGVVPPVSIEVVAFCDEEGSRFNKGLFGVRGMHGRLEEDELQRKDQHGTTRKEALIEFGCDPNQFSKWEYKDEEIGAYLELHIEQGPVLEEKGQGVGIVTGISGPLWLTVELAGFAGHAGSVPMSMRQDALVGAAAIITTLNNIASQNIENPTVGTVGNIEVFPNSRNIIAEKVRFTIDLRDMDMERRNAYERDLRKAIGDICAEQGLTYTIKEDTNSEPRYCAKWIKDCMKEGAALMNISPPELMSGPFHDALVMSYVCDYGMIFVRSKDGISHNPKEYSSYEDIALGTELLYHTTEKVLEKL